MSYLVSFNIKDIPCRVHNETAEDCIEDALVSYYYAEQMKFDVKKIEEHFGEACTVEEICKDLDRAFGGHVIVPPPRDDFDEIAESIRMQCAAQDEEEAEEEAKPETATKPKRTRKPAKEEPKEESTDEE